MSWRRSDKTAPGHAERGIPGVGKEIQECDLPSLSCTTSASLLYLKGRVHGRWVPDRWAQLVRYRIIVLFIHYGVAGGGDLSPGFPCLLLESPVQHVQALSCRNGAKCSQRRHLPRSWAGRVACGVGGMMEKCRVVVSN